MRPGKEFVIILLWLVVWLPPVAAAGHQVTVGVLAHRGVDTAIGMWTPTVDYLAEQITGHEFRLLPLDLQGMRAALERGELDFILTNPGNYVELEAGYGITRIATLKNRRHGRPSKTFGAVIFTHAGRNDIHTLADLRGKTFCAVDEGAFGGFQMAWRELKDVSIDPFRDFSELRFTGFPQDNIVFDVRDGKVDAGTVRTGILEGLAAQGLIELADFRILNMQTGGDIPFLRSTRLYPEWAFAKVRSTADVLASEVAIALLQMPDDHPASRAGDYAGWTVPLNYQPVHDLFMQLEIGPYARSARFTLAEAISRYWYWFALMLFFILLSVSFNILVKRQVNRRTAELTKEVTERQHAEEESRKLLSENRFLIQKSLAVQEGERRHLARELHDELGQCITAIQADAKIISERAPDCDSRMAASATAIQEVSSRIYEVVHSMMQRLRPGMLDDLGLIDTLNEEVDAWRARQPDTVYEVATDGKLSDLGEEINITLYRIVQECLTNIAKHAKAYHVAIGLAVVDDFPAGAAGDERGYGIRLVIQDDGVGMDPESRGSGLGLIGMRERVKGVNGCFTVVSTPGEGTMITVELPLTSAESGA
ncbi:MAG: PhnD/SsuA/transferrin family substrate-binding protein [Pseudomonadota bacterium]